MNDWRKNKFYITTQEKRVLLLIAFCFVLCILIPRYLAYRNTTFTYKISHLEDSLIKVIKVKQKNKPHQYSNNYTEKHQRNKKSPKLPFNPDTLTLEAWMKIGFSMAQAKSILKFKSFNNGIHSIEDLKKIYVIDSTQIAQWDSLLVFVPRPFLSIELNKATQEELEKLKGIGPTLAGRIIKFRTNLGGFYRLKQLNEVYGLKTAVFTKIKPHLTIDTTKITKIFINKVEAYALSKHPYLNYNQANSIVEYRNQHGLYKNPKDLLKSKLVSEEDLLKLRSYLNFKTTWK